MTLVFELERERERERERKRERDRERDRDERELCTSSYCLYIVYFLLERGSGGSPVIV